MLALTVLNKKCMHVLEVGPFFSPNVVRKGECCSQPTLSLLRSLPVTQVVWPPPSEEVHKREVQVGKLEIDEKVAQGIENRIIGKKKWQKPSSPEPQEQPKSILKRGAAEVSF